MKLRNVALLSGMGFLAWQYQHYRQDKQSAIQRLRAGSQVVTLPSGIMEYVIEGQGKPMLCIHGGGGGYEQGLLAGRIFNTSSNFQLIAPSRAGARQTPLTTGLSIAEQATAYCQLLDYLEIDKTIVVGLSAGGLSSLQFALDYPERCEALVLLSAVSPIVAQMHVPKALLTLLDMFMASDYLIWLIQKAATGFIYRSQGSNMDDFGEENPMHDLVRDIFPSSDWRENVSNDLQQVYAMKDFPFENVIVPTLLLHGDADPVSPIHVAQHTAEHIPDAKLVTIVNGSHLMMGTDTTRLHEEFHRFLDEHNITNK